MKRRCQAPEKTGELESGERRLRQEINVKKEKKLSHHNSKSS